MASPFRLPDPYVGSRRVDASEIDEYKHVNNTVYLRWLDEIAWAHSAALGIPLERCLGLRRGMAVRHTRIDYLQAALEDEVLLVATWLISSDGRLRCSRRFDILRAADGARILEAEIDYFSLNLDTGKPSRFPPEFTAAYAPPRAIAAAYAALPASDRLVGQWRR